MLKIIDFLVSMSLFYLFFILGNDAIKALGGSISLIILIPFCYYISYTQIELHFPFTFLSILLLTLISFNFFNYLDLSENYLKSTIVIANCASIFISLFSICFVLIAPLKYPYYDVKDRKVIILTQNYYYIVLMNAMLLFIYTLIMSIVFVIFSDYSLIKNYIIKIIPTSLLFFPAFFINIMISFKGFKDNSITLIFKEIKTTRLEIINIKKGYVSLMLLILIVGSVIEVFRNEWILWTESFIIINVITMLVWHVYQNMMDNRSHATTTGLLTIKTLNTPQNLIKTTLFHTIGLVFSLLILILLLYMLN